MFDLESVWDVIIFAVRAHRGQEMKCPVKTDYTAHIFGVALTALDFAESENVDKDLIVKVALLHDTIEDTSVCYDELLGLFGKDVADGVWALTKDETLPKEKQMQNSLDKILKLNKKEVAIVKLADRCFNTRCKVDSWNDEKQQEYLIEARFICDKIGFYSLPLRDKILDNVHKLEK